MQFRLSKEHPFRPVDWRYRRVIWYREKGQRPSRLYDDKATKDLSLLLARLSACVDEQAESELASQNPSIWIALEIYTDRESGLRGILEARLLAGEPAESIAMKLGVIADVVVKYAECFFDVHNRRQRQDFICAEVLGEDCPFARQRNVRELELLRVGYFRGWQVLDQLLCCGATPAVTKGSQAMAGGLYDHIEQLIARAALATAARIDLADEKSIQTVSALQAWLQAARERSEDKSPAKLDYVRNVEAFLKALSWTCGQYQLPDDMREWSETAVELRADEMNYVANGGELKNEGELRALRMRDQGEKTNCEPG